jgi:hypothetical protein
MGTKVCARCGRPNMWPDVAANGSECWAAYSGSERARRECAERQAKWMRDLLTEWRQTARTVLELPGDLEHYRTRWMHDFARSVDVALALETPDA